jgi:hypothetical protein
VSLPLIHSSTVAELLHFVARKSSKSGKKGKGKKIKGGAIAGIVIAIVVAIIVLVVILLILRRRKQKKLTATPVAHSTV